MQTNGGLSGKNSRAAKPRFAFAIAVLSRADNRLIGYQLHPKLLEQKPGNRSGASGARSCLSRFGFVACHFIDPSRERVIAPGCRKKSARNSSTKPFSKDSQHWFSRSAANAG